MTKTGRVGIILAGGRATRLFPSTLVVSKQLLPVYDKPMIFYPLSTLMLAGIRRVLIISTPEAIGQFEMLFGNGKELGLEILYATQSRPKGLADAFIVGEEFIGQNPVCLILGDNIFYGHDLPKHLTEASKNRIGATIFGYYVNDPERYGVVEFDEGRRVISIEEKPKQPKSNYAVPGLYFFDNRVIEIAKSIKPSARGEIEITDVNWRYLRQRKLKVILLGRGFDWFDAGTPEALLEASQFIAATQKRKGLLMGSPEEVAYRMGFISKEQLWSLANLYNNDYGHLLNMIR
ncbi:glucose-1-phosphate thymidylyltransferase RfbA [Candidatus Falkowbacteria bacterium]|nr:glucose-1-phosphate thymidylyltransferase RfbA [Candidatus Falkowbacteria bacterium]